MVITTILCCLVSITCILVPLFRQEWASFWVNIGIGIFLWCDVSLFFLTKKKDS